MAVARKITSVTGKGSKSKEQRKADLRSRTAKSQQESAERYIERKGSSASSRDLERLERDTAKAQSLQKTAEELQKKTDLAQAQAEQDKRTQERLREAQVQRIQEDLQVSRRDAQYIASNANNVQARAFVAGRRQELKQQREFSDNLQSKIDSGQKLTAGDIIPRGGIELTPENRTALKNVISYNDYQQQQKIEENKKTIIPIVRKDIKIPIGVPQTVVEATIKTEEKEREANKNWFTRKSEDLFKETESFKRNSAYKKTGAGFVTEIAGFTGAFTFQTLGIAENIGRPLTYIYTKEGRQKIVSSAKDVRRVLESPQTAQVLLESKKVVDDFIKNPKAPTREQVLTASVVTGGLIYSGTKTAKDYYIQNPTKVPAAILSDIALGKGTEKIIRLTQKIGTGIDAVIETAQKTKKLNLPYLDTDPKSIQQVKLLTERSQLIKASEDALTNPFLEGTVPKSPSSFTITYLEKTTGRKSLPVETNIKITDKGDLIKTQKLPSQNTIYKTITDTEGKTTFIKIQDGKTVDKVSTTTESKALIPIEESRKDLNNFIVGRRRVSIQADPTVMIMQQGILQSQQAKSKGVALLRIGEEEFVGKFAESAIIAKKSTPTNIRGQRLVAVQVNKNVGLTKLDDPLELEGTLSFGKNAKNKKELVGFFSKSEDPFKEIAFLESKGAQSEFLKSSRLEADFLRVSDPKLKVNAQMGKKGQFAEGETKKIFEFEQPVGTISRKDLDFTRIERRISIPESPKIKTKSALEEFTRGFKSVRPKSRVFIFSPTTEAEKYKNNEKSSFSIKTSPLNKVSPDFTIKQDVRALQNFDVKQDVAQKQKQDLTEKIKYFEETKINPFVDDNRIFEGTPITDTPPPPKKLIIPRLDKEEKQKSAKIDPRSAHNVYLKQKGQDIKLNKKPVSYSEAINLGARIADEYPARSFRLARAKGMVKGKVPQIDPKFAQKFKQQKKNPLYFTERTTFVIDSRNEVLGITYKGVQAKKNKNVKGGIFEY